MMETQRLIALVVFSVSAFMLWEAWQKQNAPHVPPTAAATAASPTGPNTVPAAPTVSAPAANAPAPSAAAPAVPGAQAAPVVDTSKPIVVKTDLFDVEITPLGGDIRRVTMKKQHSALDPSQPLTFVEPDPKHYFVTQTGLLGEGLPNHKTAYQPEQYEYTLPEGKDSVEVRLKATGADGAEVVKRLTFHRDEYVIDEAFDITNRSAKPIVPFAYFQFLRDSNPPPQEASQTSSFGGVTTFTGPAVYTEESHFVKVNFKDIDAGKQLAYPQKAKDGWVAIVQHYFVSAWLPKEGVEREYFTRRVGDNLYTAGTVIGDGTLAPGASGSIGASVYIGPQETQRLAKVAPGLDVVVDYGWLKVIAVPIYTVLKWIHSVVQNWGWSIIIFTVLIKLIFYPLNAKAGRSMAQMKVLGPKMEKLKEMYGEDRQKLNQAMMELYRQEKVNPLGGCLPILVQIPVFIALYWVLLASIELRHAPWLGWIHDLSAPDPFFILPVIYAVSMFVQTRLNPAPADPVQAKVMMIMPIVFSVFFLFFPAGLVLYWVCQNLLSIVQQWHINKTLANEAKAKARR